MIYLFGILAFLFRILLISRDSVPFAYDMGRDLLWAKDIAFYHIPTLLGPAASIWGVYFPPLWYYLLAPPLLLSNGHPLSAVYTTAAVVALSGVGAFFAFKRILGRFYALTLSAFILFGANLINISTFAFHANVLPLLSLIFLTSWFLAQVKNPNFIPLAFLTAGLMFSADPAPAVVTTIVSVCLMIIYKPKHLIKTTVLSIFAFSLPIASYFIFEIRNGFIQTKSTIAYFAGNNPSLSGQLPLFARIANRADIFSQSIVSGFAGANLPFAIALLILVIFGFFAFLKVKDSSIKLLYKLNLIILFLNVFIFTFLFTVELKGWYLYGLYINFAILFALSIFALKIPPFPKAIFVAVYIAINALPFVSLKRNTNAQSDPALLANQTRAIDLIYEDGGKPFSVYIFTPSIYDYHYQYLFWWYGIRLKKGLPSDFAYAPNIPSYVKNKEIYQKDPKVEDTIYLILENAPQNEFFTQKIWMGNFQGYKTIWSQDIESALTVQKLTK